MRKPERGPKAHRAVGCLLEGHCVMAKTKSIPGHWAIPKEALRENPEAPDPWGLLPRCFQLEENAQAPSPARDASLIQFRNTHTHAHSAVNSESWKSNLELTQRPKEKQPQLQPRAPAHSHRSPQALDARQC